MLDDHDFAEIGASGRIWDRATTISALAAEPNSPRMTADGFVPVSLGEDAVLLTFRTVALDRACLRSSVWLRDATGHWLLRFHQGTVVPSGANPSVHPWTRAGSAEETSRS